MLTGRALAERFRNGDMCRLTEQVIFTDPYYDAPVNKHCSPKLDSLVLALRTDTEAKVVVSGLKVRTGCVHFTCGCHWL